MNNSSDSGIQNPGVSILEWNPSLICPTALMDQIVDTPPPLFCSYGRSYRAIPRYFGFSTRTVLSTQLKNGVRYLDADDSSDRVGLNPGSNYDNGSSQKRGK